MNQPIIEQQMNKNNAGCIFQNERYGYNERFMHGELLLCAKVRNFFIRLVAS